MRLQTVEETIRWPVKLDHDAIVERLVHLREEATVSGPRELSICLEDVEHMPAAAIALRVATSLYWLLGKTEHRWLTKHLEMVALNLRNLRDQVGEPG